MKKIEFFKVEGDSINRFRKHCPKCGPGIFLGEHKDRFSCGNCGYTEYKSGGKKEPKPQKIEEKPIEEPKTPEVPQEPEQISEETPQTKPEQSTEESPDESGPSESPEEQTLRPFPGRD